MSEYDFTQSFLDSESRKDQFSYSALKAMYEYYEQLEDDLGEPIEFDMIALCCEWTEYTSAVDALREYADNHYQIHCGIDHDENEQIALEWLREHTQVIEFDGTVELSDGTIIGDKGVLVAQF